MNLCNLFYFIYNLAANLSKTDNLPRRIVVICKDLQNFMS